MPNDKKIYRNINDRIRKNTNSGKRNKIKYSSKIDKFGRLTIERSGVDDLSAYINSFRDSVNLNVLLQKFVNGDESALNKTQGVYMDVSKFPTSYAEVLNIVNDGINVFNGLPMEIKNKFNNNAYEFITKLDTDEYYDALGIEKPVKKEVKKTKVKKPVVESEDIKDE